MIIEYTHELLHKHTAINAIITSYDAFKRHLLIASAERCASYYSQMNAILACVCGAHKFDYIRLCSDNRSRYSEIQRDYTTLFSDEEQLRAAIAKYQSANPRDMIDKLKPCKIINRVMSGKPLTRQQTQRGTQWCSDLTRAFVTAAERHRLQPGQRLFRGITLPRQKIDNLRSALKSKIHENYLGFTSTSLSECVALSFAVIADSTHLTLSGDGDLQSHLPVVIELTNRRQDLPFLMPDAIRKPERNQGQLEILLDNSLSLKPTWIEAEQYYVKVFADIV